MDHYPRGRLPAFWETETTVANSATWRAHPRVLHQDLSDVLAVAIQETRTAELTADAATVAVVADRLGIGGLLAALVARGTVDSVVYLFGCLDGHLVDFRLVADWIVVQFYLNRLFLTVPTLPIYMEGKENQSGKRTTKNSLQIISCK